MDPRKVLKAMLLEVLFGAPDGLATRDAYAAIERRYRLPPEWLEPLPTSAGYKASQRGWGADASALLEGERPDLPTEPMWQNSVRWARNSLMRKGLLDRSAGKGRWRLTPAGRDVATRPTHPLNDDERLMFRQCSAGSEGVVAPRERDRSHRLSAELQELSKLARKMTKPEIDELLAQARAIVKRRRGG